MNHFIIVVSLRTSFYIVNDLLMLVLFHMTIIIDIKMNVETIVNMRGKIAVCRGWFEVNPRRVIGNRVFTYFYAG